ncbi:MAG: hypothetical protein IPH97_15880 [Ignavibacteriales bacterium]|nr:hypothetical protein [Ignavibacteriales bacterium]
MEHYKIAVKKGEYNIEVSSHDQKWVEDKIKTYKSFFEDLPNKPIENIGKVQTTFTEKAQNLESISINEFYKKFIAGKVSSRPEIATFFVYYLTKSKNQKEFNSAEIKEQFREVGYPAWNGINIADTLNQAKKRALLNNFNSQWSLSLTGEDFILNKISNES